jgi:hypothetical protein
MTPTKSASVKKKASVKKVRAKAAAPKKKAVVAKATPKKKAVAKAAPRKKTVVPASIKKAAAPKKKTAAPKKKAAPKKAAVLEKKAAPQKTAVLAKPVALAKKAAPKKTTALAKPVAKEKAVAKKAVTVSVAGPLAEEVVEVVVQVPAERPLTDEEREAMQKCAHTALAALAADGVPEVIVTRIGRFIDDVRAGMLPEPSNQDVRLGLGVLWGEQVRAQVGWRWVHLSYPNGFASYALVPDDRAFACFPLNRLGELLRAGADGVNTSVPLFDSIRVGTLPDRSENAYLVIG